MSDDARIAALEAEVRALRDALAKLEADRWDRVYDRLAEIERRPGSVKVCLAPTPALPQLTPMYPGGPLRTLPGVLNLP